MTEYMHTPGDGCLRGSGHGEDDRFCDFCEDDLFSHDPDIVEIPMNAFARRRQTGNFGRNGKRMLSPSPRRPVAGMLCFIGALVLLAVLSVALVTVLKLKKRENISATDDNGVSEPQTVLRDENAGPADIETDPAREAEVQPSGEASDALAATSLSASETAGREETMVTPAIPTPHPLSNIGRVGTHGRYLSLNDEYPIIASIQERLHELGYMEVPVINGVEGFTTSYGPATRTAVRAFQAVNNIEADGLLGETTYDLLMSDKARPLIFNNSCSDTVFESYIIKLQTRLIELHYLEGKVSGKFTDRTTLALKAFQTRNGLSPDGTAGPLTLEALYGDNAIDSLSNETNEEAPAATPAATAPIS